MMVSKNTERLFIITCQLPLRAVYPRKDRVFDAVNAFAAEMPAYAKTAFNELFWAGAPGCSAGAWAHASVRIPAFPFGLCPVFIREREHEMAGQAFSHQLMEDGYMRINREFSEALERYIRPYDTLWIPDHRLLPLAARIRKRMPEISIGSFVSVEFPGYEAMTRMPRDRQEEFLKGMLGADLVAFQREEDRGNFLQCVQLLLGIDNEEGAVRIGERFVSTYVVPLAAEGEGDGEWLRNGLSALRASKAGQEHLQVRFFDMHSRNELLDRYRGAQKRLFLLDYDGTLTPFFNLPALAKPDNLLLDILGSIARNPRNSVYIVSGRDSQTLDNWLGHLPVNIIAEHGARVRPYEGQWEEKAVPAVKWKNEVEPVMSQYLERCLHSFVEHKDFSIVWHYRNSLPEQVKEVKMEMYAALCRIAEEWKLQVVMGNKIVEVRNAGMDKGRAIQDVLSGEERDFILAIGDDRTDEDMFRILAKVDNAFTIKVGAEASFAKFNMHTPQMVISLLGSMVFLEGQR